MNVIGDGLRWLTTADNWTGRNGIGHALLQHLWYSLLATSVAVVIALPIGLWIGHTGRGRFVAANVTGIWRAIPTIGIVTIVFRWYPLSVWPVLIALVVLAIPPIVLNTVAGFVGLGTLGVFIFTATSTQRYDVMAGASIAVIVLVLSVEALFALLQRLIVSEGVRARTPRRLRRAATVPGEVQRMTMADAGIE